MSLIKCCCEAQNCSNIEKDEFSIKNIRKNMYISEELVQHLLSECKTYIKNTEYKEKLFKLEISRLKAIKNQAEMLLISFKKKNRELEEKMYNINKKNIEMLNDIENLNMSLSISKFHIKDLSDALETTKLELESIRSYVHYGNSLKEEISAIKLEKNTLNKELEQSRKIGIFFKKKWKQSEQIIKELKDQIDKNELKKYLEINTANTNSIKSLSTIKKPDIVLLKELIARNSFLKNVCIKLYINLSMSQNEITRLQQVLFEKSNNTKFLHNISFNSYNTIHTLLYDAYCDNLLFLEKNFSEILNYFLNESANILSMFSGENQERFPFELFNESESKQRIINTLLFSQKEYKKLFNGSKIIRSFSMPNILSSSNKFQSIRNNISRKMPYIVQDTVFDSLKLTSTGNKIQHSFLNFSEDLYSEKCDKLDSGMFVYSNTYNDSFFTCSVDKETLYKVKSEDLHDSFLFKKPWTFLRIFSLPTQFTSPVISTFTSVPTKSSIFLNSNTKTMLSNSLLKPTITKKNILINNSKKKKYNIKLWRKSINNKDKGIWGSVFNKWLKLIHLKYPTSISTNNTNVIIVKN